MDLILPFKIGDFAEALSFVPGFNGAWFRCKINDMRVTESGHLEYYLEYIDYTEEGKEWVEVFQKNPNLACQKGKSGASSQIMLRPSFPKWYREDQLPEHFPETGVVASVHDTWKVGDLIDWLCQDCYWTGKITRLLSENQVEIKLLKPPMGEGGCHRANCKDLRPALDWSIIKGWTVPPSKARGKCWYVAHLIHPKSDIEESYTDEEMASDVDKEEERKSLKRALNTYDEEVLGSSSLTPSSASDTNSISEANNQNATATSMKRSRPTSTYKSDPSYGAQAAVGGNRPGISNSSKPRKEMQSAHTFKGAMTDQNKLSDGITVRRYPFRARKIVKNGSRKIVKNGSGG